MSKEFEFKIDTEKVEKALAAIPGRKTTKIMRRALNEIGFEHSNWMKRRRFVPYRGRSPRNKLQTRTGGLRRSIGHKTKGSNLGNLQVRMFVGAKHGHIHETGGTIRPKRRQWLTVPTKAALTKGGALSGRYRIRTGWHAASTRAGSSRGAYETDAGPTFIFKGKSGGLFIGIRKRDGTTIKVRGGSPKAFYVLKKSVHISPRLGFKIEFNKHTKRYIVRRIGQAGDQMVKEAVEA